MLFLAQPIFLSLNYYSGWDEKLDVIVSISPRALIVNFKAHLIARDVV